MWNERSKEHNESKNEKEQQVSLEEKLHNQQQQEEEDINGEFDHTLMEENVEDGHLNKGIQSTMFKFLCNLCEVIIQNEMSEEYDGSKTTKDQEDSIKEKLPDHQQQQGITGMSELNIVNNEDSLSNNPGRVLNGNDANPGSKLLIKDENDGSYHITQGIPSSIKFCCISNLYMVIYIYLCLLYSH